MSLAVGLLHYTVPPVVGGVEAVVGRQAAALAGAGHRVRLLAGRGRAGGPGVALARLPLADTRHQRVRDARAALDAGHVPPGFDRLVAALADGLAAAADGLDVLVAHNVCGMPFNLALTAALRAAHDAGRLPPLVAWHHDVAVGAERFAGTLHPGPPWSLLAEAWPGVTQVAVSEARADDLAAATGLARAEVTVVPNGLDLEGFLGLHAATRRLLDGLGRDAGGPLLLLPARLTPRKRVELAIAALAVLRAEGEDAHLLVTGPPDPHEAGTPGGYPDRLLALARQLGVARAVHLPGLEGARPLPARVVADLYRVADVLLLPSGDEGFGLPVIEAGAARLPIACTDLPPLRALAGDAAAYFALDADPATVAAAVRSRLDGEAARLRARVAGTLGWPAVVARQVVPVLAAAAARGRAEPEARTRAAGARQSRISTPRRAASSAARASSSSRPTRPRATASRSSASRKRS